MYVVQSIQGSSHFKWSGPHKKKMAEEILSAWESAAKKSGDLPHVLPLRTVSNREAESWRYRDGSRVIRRFDSYPETAKPGSHPKKSGLIT